MDLLNKSKLKAKKRTETATKISYLGLFVNTILTIIKFIAGIFGNSSAMIADATNSFSDVATDLVVIASFKMVQKPIDDTHDYGHGKFETFATFIIGVVIIFVGIGIFRTGLLKAFDVWEGRELASPGMLALIVATISIITKEVLYRYQVKVGNEINSQAVIAKAWDHRSDALSSIGTFIGIGGAIVLGKGFVILDPIAAMIVSVFVLRVAIKITFLSAQELLEVALPKSEKEKIVEYVLLVKGAHNPHRLRTRKIGSYWAVDMHIEVESALTVLEAHEIADSVENILREKLGYETLVTVHVDPKGELGD